LHLTSQILQDKNNSATTQRLADAVRNVSGRASLGSFGDSRYYGKLFARLQASRRTALTDSKLADNRFNDMRRATLVVLAPLLDALGRSVAPFADELLQYLGVHFEASLDYVVPCVTRLFVALFRPASAITSARVIVAGETSTATSTDATDAPRDAEVALPAPLLQSGTPAFMHAVLRPPYFTAPPLPVDCSGEDEHVSIKLVERILSRDNNRTLLRKFGPIVLSAMAKYGDVATLPIKQAILSLLTTLMKHGVDMARLDKDGVFGESLLRQIAEISTRHEQPDVVTLFPSLFDCVVAPLAVARKSDARTMERTLHVCSASAQFIVTHWRHCGERERTRSFARFTQYLFSTAVARAAQTAQHRASLLQLRDSLLHHLLRQVTRGSAAAIQLVRVALRSAAEAHSSQLPDYSRQVVASLLPRGLYGNGASDTTVVAPPAAPVESAPVDKPVVLKRMRSSTDTGPDDPALLRFEPRSLDELVDFFALLGDLLSELDLATIGEHIAAVTTLFGERSERSAMWYVTVRCILRASQRSCTDARCTAGSTPCTTTAKANSRSSCSPNDSFDVDIVAEAHHFHQKIPLIFDRQRCSSN
jgi:hypothetical protein